MNAVKSNSRVAVIGTGLAGAWCARSLAAQGWAVQVFDKARGAGGRLATRRLDWTDAQGGSRTARLDHGAPAFTARGAAFQRYCEEAVRNGALQRWRPTLAPGSRPLDDVDAAPLFVAQPDMPALCRQLLGAIPATWSVTVDRLTHGAQGWQLEAAGERLPQVFDAVVLAMPLPQTASLLAPHRSDWAQRAALCMMQPCWTLMGVTQAPSDLPPWDLTRPPEGPLAWVMRHEGRPGRQHAPGEIHWVAHARPAWSRQHLERDPHWVQAQLQGALHEALGTPLAWQQASVHRWRFATPANPGAEPETPCWWDAHQALGVCGDAFAGTAGTGVEAAWRSAQALGEAIAMTHGSHWQSAACVPHARVEHRSEASRHA